ncbi:hypothetical protein [Frisingicoccus sp.]|uniref:hypothetical protein n=1 Tax=Frisingicoccus sp. TaxID=1918627 RepID=UPI003AB3AE2B
MFIKKYIEEKIPELSGRLYPVFTADIEHLTVAYRFTPVTGGHLKQYQLELKVIWLDYDECTAVEKELVNLLDMQDDDGFIRYAGVSFHSELSGGGMLFNEGCQMFEDTLYFIISWR